MTEFSSDNQPEHDKSEAAKRGWDFKRTFERVLAGEAVGSNKRVPLYERIVRAHVKKALTGDIPALKELYERIDGKSEQPVKLSGGVEITRIERVIVDSPNTDR